MDFKRYLLRLRLHRLDDCPVEANLLLHELMPGSEVKSGYLRINDTDCCWHTWLETKDVEVIDIGYELAILKDPEFRNCKVERLMEKPETGEVHEDRELIERFNGPIADFWKTAPKQFRDFRSKFKRSLNK